MVYSLPEFLNIIKEIITSRAIFLDLNWSDDNKLEKGYSSKAFTEKFEEANRNVPSVIFIEEIDAIAPKRVNVRGNVKKRVVAQLLALMDSLVTRGQVVVIGATNILEVLVPTLEEGEEIFKIHLSGLNLAEDVDLRELAEQTEGFVGSDIEAVQEVLLLPEWETSVNKMINMMGAPSIDKEDIPQIVEYLTNSYGKKE